MIVVSSVCVCVVGGRGGGGGSFLLLVLLAEIADNYKIDIVKRVSTDVLAMLPSSGYKTILYPEEGSIAETSVETVLTASIL